MANNGILLSIQLSDFFPPCYVFRLNKCKTLGSLQLWGKELSRVSWPCPTVGGQCWPGCGWGGGLGLARCRSRPWQIASVSPSRAPSAGCSLTGRLHPVVVLISAGGLWLRGMGDRDGERSPGITHGSACGRAPTGDREQPFPRGGRENFSKHPPHGPNPLIAQ